MGGIHSKLTRNKKRSKTRAKEEQQEREECEVDDADLIAKQDQATISAIKKDIIETPEVFVLNNLLMCTMFLKNYDKDIYEVFQKVKKSQDSLYWEPDVIMEKANQNVIYRPMHGPKKDIAEPLVKRRIYVPLNEYIDVCDPLNDNEEIEKKSSSKYRVKTEDSKRHGYVKLQRLDGPTNHEKISLKDVLSIPSSQTSGSSDTESNCTSLGTMVQENLIKYQTEEGTLDDCFVFRKVKKVDIDIDLEDMDHDNIKDEDVYDIVSYLTSRNFMKYVQSKVFRDAVVAQLGLNKYEIEEAVVDANIPGKIFCNLRDQNGNSYPIEVLPCLKSSWPSKQTYELTEEKGEIDVRDTQPFQWPTENMLNEMKQLECALVPKGYSRKRGEYPEGELEWEMHFPLAEAYLATLLRPEQIKCYLILLSLYKEYLEPYTKNFGVVPEHLLTLIFWESEKDYDSWPEHRLGFRLINMINIFSKKLCERKMRDFFVRKKNILRNVSRKHLTTANEVFHNIKQSPMTSIIRALRNIRNTSGLFYPPLDYKELLDILYKQDWDVDPYWDGNTTIDFSYGDNISVSTKSEKKPKFADAEKQLAYVKEKEKRRRLMQKRENQLRSKSVPNLSSYSVNMEVRRGSVDSVKDDWECEKHFDRQKKIALLKFFIRNYMDLAKTSYKISSMRQTLFYLKQAWYLAKILEEENQLFGEEVAEFFKNIKAEEDKVISAMQKNIRSHGSLEVTNDNRTEDNEEEESLANLDDIIRFNLPYSELQRNADTGIRQQIRQTIINLRSLSRSFSNTYVPTE